MTRYQVACGSRPRLHSTVDWLTTTTMCSFFIGKIFQSENTVTFRSYRGAKGSIHRDHSACTTCVGGSGSRPSRPTRYSRRVPSPASAVTSKTREIYLLSRYPLFYNDMAYCSNKFRSLSTPSPLLSYPRLEFSRSPLLFGPFLEKKFHGTFILDSIEIEGFCPRNPFVCSPTLLRAHGMKLTCAE